jgi:cyanophycinase-like exopeptidase
MTRVLAVMGSGETAPTHTKTHRQLIDRVTGPAVMLDTPYGFQANADDISQRAVEYFDRSVQRPITVSSWRRGDDAALVRETALTRLRGAGYVFAGPGSPTYALRQWAGSALPALLAEKLQPGADGVVTFASAAALTLGRVTVPVYEIYKVGEEPRWFDGLDLVGAVTGWSVAVIPHFDNAEGGGHDTRFCYLGEPRLQVMEAQLPDGAWVLGVDEHTALLLDLDEQTATVVGLGGVTVRSGGQVRQVVPTGETVPMDALRAAAEGRTLTAVGAPEAVGGGG